MAHVPHNFRPAVVDALRQLFQQHKQTNTHLEAIMSTLKELQDLQSRLQTDVAQQTQEISTIQANLTAQLQDLSGQIQQLREGNPQLDLTNLTMSVNQLEANHAALLALAKQVTGADIPQPAPLVSTAPSSELAEKPPTAEPSL